MYSDSLIYQKAFVRYLRKGIPLEISLKAEIHPTPYYIWRTQDDGKVRASHAANNGKIFAWDNPPPTGHPGEDYNCRCFAEPYALPLDELVLQVVTSKVLDVPERWGWSEFFHHYHHGNGNGVTLSHIGHLQAVIDHAKQHIFERVEAQVIRKGREIISGTLSDNFNNSYSFYGVSLVHGNSTVSGNISGSVEKFGNFLRINVNVNYAFHDVFTDIFSQRERETGTSSLENVSQEELEATESGIPYDIDGTWSTNIFAIIRQDPSVSQYK